MTAILPPIPRFVFTVFEPISLVAGAVAPLISLPYFVTSQLGHIPAHPLYETEQILSLQLGNAYMLLCLIGLFVLNTTTEARVVHGYLVALAIADLGHLFVTAYVSGYSATIDVLAWNPMAWGNLGGTSFLFVMRCAYFAGLLGEDRIPRRSGKKSI